MTDVLPSFWLRGQQKKLHANQVKEEEKEDRWIDRCEEESEIDKSILCAWRWSERSPSLIPNSSVAIGGRAWKKQEKFHALQRGIGRERIIIIIIHRRHHCIITTPQEELLLVFLLLFLQRLSSLDKSTNQSLSLNRLFLHSFLFSTSFSSLHLPSTSSPSGHLFYRYPSIHIYLHSVCLCVRRKERNEEKGWLHPPFFCFAWTTRHSEICFFLLFLPPSVLLHACLYI